jgi:predicted ArsR family transcriptional regulator
VCTVCSHEKRFEIEELLATRQGTYRGIARKYSVSEDAISRHVSSRHISQLLALAADAERAAHADTLLDRLEALQGRTEEALAKAESSDNPFATFRGISEMRRNLELIGELTKELDRTPTLNLHLNAEWIEIRTAILHALEPYSEARESVLRAIGSVGNGSA